MKRRFLCIVLALCMAVSLIPTTAFATGDTETELSSGTCGENLTWTLADGTLTISGTGTMSAYTQGGVPWVANADSIVSVVIESGATSIGENAFAGCSNLTSVTISDGVTAIGDSAFSYCYGLTSISIPARVTSIGEGVFWGSGLKDLYYGGTEEQWTALAVTASDIGLPSDAMIHYTEEARPRQIYQYNYYSDTGFAWGNVGAMLPEVVTIEPYPAADETVYRFLGWYEVTERDGDGLAAAYGEKLCDTKTYQFTMTERVCYLVAVYQRITSCDHTWDEGAVTTPATCEQPGVRTYTCTGCGTKKTEVVAEPTGHNHVWTVTKEPTCTETGIETQVCQHDASHTGETREIAKLEHSWDEGTILQEAQVDSSGMMLYTCTKCGEKKSEFIPPLVLEGSYGRCGKDLIWNLVDGTLTISGTGEMFQYHNGGVPWYSERDSITAVVIENGVSSLGNAAFVDCTNLESVIIADSVTEIKTWVFSNCSNLTRINLPRNLINLGDYAFYRCTNLESIVLPEGLSEISYMCFEECHSLKSITIPYGITRIGKNAFSDCSSLESIRIPNSVTSIGASAFSGCTNMKSVSLSNSLSTIEAHSFLLCSSLTSIEIPSQISRIGEGAFHDCSSLSDVALPSSVTSIGAWAFANCDNLTSITIPGGVDYIGDYAFWRCNDLEQVTIAHGVTAIGEYCFAECVSLLSVSFPKTLNSIGESAFNGCYVLKDGTLWDGITVLGSGAFRDCRSIQYAIIPATLSRIESNLFQSCMNLQYVVIPQSIESIGDFAFNNCPALTDIYYEGSEMEWASISIGLWSLTDDITIHYKSSDLSIVVASGTFGENLTWSLDDKGVLNIGGLGWMPDFSEEEGNQAPWFPYREQIKKVVIAMGVFSIGDYAFDHCANISQITIPEKLMTVGRYAFRSCTGLSSIAFPTSVYEALTEIETGAFTGCGRLASVSLPVDLKTVGESAFSGCHALSNVYYYGYAKDWAAVSIQSGNECLTAAEFHCKTLSAIDTALQRSSVYYDNDLALIAAELSMATYTGSGDSAVRNYLYDQDFKASNIYSNNYGGSLAFTIATKPYYGYDMSGCTDILVIVAQGSTNPYELFNDAFSIYSPGIGGHTSYVIVKNFYNAMYEGIQYMLDRNILSSDKNYKVLLTGHSLGGAAVDLLAGSLTDRNGSDDIYCYTFGAINSIVSGSSVGYRNIHNVYNDLDTFSPAQYGWVLLNGAGGKYGKIGHLDSFEYDYRDPALVSWWGAVVQVSNHINHDMGNYLEAVRAGRITNSPLRSCPYAIIACPVDVDVFCDGVLVGRVKNNVVDETVTTIDIIVDGDVKFILNPENKKFDITITAFDEGTMTYYAQDPNGLGEAKLMYNIELVPGKEMVSTIGGDINIPDIKLYVLGDDETPILEVHEDGTETEIVEQTPAILQGRNLNLEGKIGVNFFLTLPEEFLQDPGACVRINGAVMPIPEPDAGWYKFSWFVAAKEMRDDIVLQLFDGQGQPYPTKDKNGADITDGFTFSVQAYFDLAHDPVNEQAATQALLTMLDRMSDYGMYAQVHFRYNQGNAVVTDEMQARLNAVTEAQLAAFTEVVTTVDGSQISYAGASLLLESETSIRHYFLLSGGSIGDYEFLVDGQHTEPVDTGNGYFYVTVRNIAAKDLDKAVPVQVKKAGQTVVALENYSALSYVQRVIKAQANGEQNLLNLVRSLYLYNQSAKAYFV